MAVEWTGFGPELLIPLDRDRDEPLRSQLERGLREAIRSGRLRAGERLPSTRELARGLGVSRGLVVDCFDQLQAEGYVLSRRGSATRVAETVRPATPTTSGRPVAERSDRRRLDVDFVPAVPDLASFPRAEWAWAVREACRIAPNSTFGYGEGRGNEELCAVVASYVSRVRGAAADPERTVICSGFSQGLNLSIQALAARGIRRVAFEDPGYDETGKNAAAAAGVKIVAVPVDGEGVRVDTLEQADVQAVVLTPAHQWPTGVVLSPPRRHALVRWAASVDGWIIEDDYDAEFRYDHDPVGAVQGLAPEHVILIGTVSKSLAPTLRLGWMICPTELVEPIATLKRDHDRGSPGLEQAALATLIESGRFDRHLRRMRKEYAARRDALVDALATHAPSVRLTGLAAGFHAVLHLRGDLTEADVIAGARARGVGLYGMSPQRRDRAADPPQLVLGFGTLGERMIRDGIARVGDLLEGPTDGPRSLVSHWSTTLPPNWT